MGGMSLELSKPIKRMKMHHSGLVAHLCPEDIGCCGGHGRVDLSGCGMWGSLEPFDLPLRAVLT